MTKPFALQTVLELMQIRADEATNRLARLIASERDARNKLEMLQQYRDEYAARFRQAAQNGLTQRQWHNYQEFLNRLDEAIDSQLQTVALQVRNTASGQTQWQQQRTKLKAFDALSCRHYASENAQTLKREQKTQDEFSARFKSDKKSG
jgi:flagellar FliJ protein